MTTRHFRSHLVPVSILLAVAATACGSDESTLTRAEYQTAANDICTKAEASMEPIFGEIFPKLDTATEEERQAAADDLLQVVSAEIDDLAALKPPSDIADDVDAMLAAARDGADVIREQGAGFWLDESDPFADVNQRAAALDLDACAGDSAN